MVPIVPNPKERPRGHEETYEIMPMSTNSARISIVIVILCCLGAVTRSQDTIEAPAGTRSLVSTFGWERYIGKRDRMIGMKTFGASAPLKAIQKKFGFEPDQVVTAAKELLARKWNIGRRNR